MNKVMLIGNLAADPEHRATQTGRKVTSFSVATNRDWKTQSGEKARATDFHRIITWGKLAEVCSQYLRKGKGVYIGGRLSNRTFVGRDGQKKYFTEIVADEINFLSSRNSDGHELEVGLEDVTVEKEVAKAL